MKPLIVLTIGFVLSLIALKLIQNQHDFALSARIAMSIMLQPLDFIFQDLNY